jgi:hypothetical protein
MAVMDHHRSPSRARRIVAALALAVPLVLTVASCADDTGVAAAPAAVRAADTPEPMPWAEQPDGAPSIHAVTPRESLEFPPGVDYGQALARLFTAARGGGLPEGTRTLPPLPVEVVYAEAPDPTRGLRLSLTAPWGWVPGTGAIRAPSVALPGSLTTEEAQEMARRMADPTTPLPPEARVDVPDLPACQVRDADGERPPCP